MYEVCWSGLEYLYNDSFAVRAGYFNENENKGSRKYLTMGTGFNIGFIEIDISYLFSKINCALKQDCNQIQIKQECKRKDVKCLEIKH